MNPKSPPSKTAKPAFNPPASLAAAEAVVSDIASLQLQRRRAEIERDQAIAGIRSTFAMRLDALETAIAEKTCLVKSWAEANPTAFGAARSIEMTHATVGWRTGQPQLKHGPRMTWPDVVAKLKTLGWFSCIRTTEEVDKQYLLAHRSELEVRAAGCRVVQAETFFIDPKASDSRITLS